MSPLATILWITNLFIDTFGQLSFKAAANVPAAEGVADRWRAMLGNHWIWLGIGTYVVEFFVYLAFLTKVPLSQGVLMGSLNIVVVMLGGKIFFKEALTPTRMLATFLIAVGVALVGWGGGKI
ncbi:MAG TPA: EamA family transporter [Oculatellaceae cyanobacterium]